MPLVAIDHVRLAMPAGREDDARDDDLPGVRRAYVHDSFGNRVELTESAG